MRLSEVQSCELFRVHGAYLREACDRCCAVLGSIRWTIRGEPGVFCSQLCRDGSERKAGVCQGCGVSLIGKRKHARFCSDVCRKRQQVRDRRKNPETPIADKGLTDPVSGFGCVGTKTAQEVTKHSAIEVNDECENSTR
jgi:hypothetical protein